MKCTVVAAFGVLVLAGNAVQAHTAIQTFSLIGPWSWKGTLKTFVCQPHVVMRIRAADSTSIPSHGSRGGGWRLMRGSRGRRSGSATM
jgi:hypothetical protein